MIKFKDTGVYRIFRRFEQNARKKVKKFLLEKKLGKGDPVFIFQMGKVASSSIHHSLKKQYPGAVVHAHHIGEPNWASEVIFDWYRKGNRVKIISPVRDPIGRNVSSFFQQYSDYSERELARLNLDINKLIDDFIEQYPHDYPLTWFDENIKRNFGIDVYESAFSKEGGAVYESGNASLLVFRIDMDDSRKENAIRQFLDFDSFSLINRNISSEKKYYSKYREFINSIKLPESYLSKMQSSRYFRHFYDDGEIEDILEKWR